VTDGKSRGAGRVRLTSTGLLSFVLCLWAAGTSRADDLTDFKNAADEALAHARTAGFYLDTRNPGVAAFELQVMQDKWQALMKRFADAPPAAFAGDRSWKESLTQIGERVAAALTAANDNDLKAGKQDLLQIRQEMSALYKRNHMRTFSDNIDELGAAVARLSLYIKNSPDFTRFEQVDALITATTAVTTLTRKCRAEAPPAYQQNQEFGQLIDGMLESLGFVMKAIEQKDAKAVGDNIRAIRSYDHILFLRFG
jgi:hypothetical protein